MAHAVSAAVLSAVRLQAYMLDRMAVRPPSSRMIDPVTKADARELKKRSRPPMSVSFPTLPTGCLSGIESEMREEGGREEEEEMIKVKVKVLSFPDLPETMTSHGL